MLLARSFGTNHRGLVNVFDGFSCDNKHGGFNVIGANGFEELPKDTAQ